MSQSMSESKQRSWRCDEVGKAPSPLHKGLSLQPPKALHVALFGSRLDDGAHGEARRLRLAFGTYELEPSAQPLGPALGHLAHSSACNQG